MKVVIALFGALICVAGLILLASPATFRNVMKNFAGRLRFLFAIVIRLALGAVLIAAAESLRFPLAMKIIGAIFIVAAIGITIAGQQRLDRIIDYWMRKPDTLFRVVSLFAMAFGALFVYVTT